MIILAPPEACVLPKLKLNAGAVVGAGFASPEAALKLKAPVPNVVVVPASKH